MKFTYLLASIIFLSIIFTPTASAHVSVKPSEVGIATSQDFSIGFGVEKDIPTTAIRLVIPEGVEEVAPYQKAGWKIDVKKDGERVTEIVWSSGSVPAGYRETFQFRAKVPATEKTIAWKAYQTYEDGSVVAWDQDPKAEGHHDEVNEAEETSGPYSETKIINDLKAGSTSEQATSQNNMPFVISFAALLIALASLALQFRKK
jgi:uncharacterized protein YcnI